MSIMENNHCPSINAEMNAKHRALIQEVRQRLGHLFTDEFQSDFDILRWLQGHDYNLDVVIAKLRCHLRFRRAFDFRRYEGHPVMEHFSFGFVGPTGKDNNFVFLDCTGRNDGEGLLRSIPLMSIILTTVQRMEKFALAPMRKREEETGRQSGLYLIMDLEGVNSNGVSTILGSFRPFGLFLQHHYVELFQKILLINTASYLYYIWRLLKPFLPERTQKKVIILSSDWKKELLQYVDPGFLPVHWGGTLVDENGDPMCRNRLVALPEKVALDQYWKPSPDEPPKESLVQLVISCGKHDFISVPVREPGCTLRWYFFTDAEYSFGVYRADRDEEFDTEVMEMVFPHINIIAASWRRPEMGSLKCDKKGVYRLRFGNEHQWLSRLRVSYKVEVIYDQ